MAIIRDYFAGEDAILVERVSVENIQISSITTEEFEQLVTDVFPVFQGGSKIEAIATGEILGFVENNFDLTVEQLNFCFFIIFHFLIKINTTTE